MGSISDEDYYDCRTEPVKYYAVACQKDIDSGLVTTDIKEALQKVKIVKGSRFNSFYNLFEAQKFSESFLLENVQSETTILATDNPGPFVDVPIIKLNEFKRAIEKGDCEKCLELISINPRYLVTTNDMPTILQTNFKLNALHIAAKSNQPKSMLLVLDCISQDQFWCSLHPDSDDHTNNDRRQRVIDMYLNKPNSQMINPGAALKPQNNDTPLHIAASEGNGECVRALLNQELTDTTMINGKRFLAKEVICDRYTRSDKEARISEISDIFAEKYVVLLTNDARMHIMEPVSHCHLLRLLRTFNNGFDPARAVSPTNGGEFVRAYIGPLSDTAASELHRRWSVLNEEDAVMFYHTRHNDAEKGLECHGRYLAQLFGAPWKEFWQFLNCYTDFGADDGLAKLEEHLTTMVDEEEEEEESGKEIEEDEESVKEWEESGEEGSILYRAYDSLARLFSRLTLGSPRPSSHHSSIIDAPSSPCPVTSTPLIQHRLITSLRQDRPRLNSSVLGQGVLTPTDKHVRQAVLATTDDRLHRYPHISSWLNDLSSLIDIADHAIVQPSISDAITSTPLRIRPRPTNTFPPLAPPPSPLV